MKINGQVFHQSRHLNENQLAPSDPTCPFCGSCKRQSEYTLQQEPEVLLLKCESCHASSASRIPTADALTDYYNNYYSAPDGEQSEQVTFDQSHRFGAHLALHFNAQLSDKQHISMLDFGGGDGSIAIWTAKELLKQGVKSITILLVDYNEHTVDPNDQHIQISREENLEQKDEYFDIIIASAIIEHIPHPAKTLDQLMNSLKPGGLFYARTPYVAPLMKLFSVFNIKWDFTFPAHIHDLGQSFWEHYFKGSRHHSQFELLRSTPSIVETTLQEHSLRTIAAYTLKAPWVVFGNAYKLVGGWEVFARKRPLKDANS